MQQINTKKEMLGYAKVILKNVDCDEKIFRNELVKLIYWLKNNEVRDFKKWCDNTYGSKYGEIIKNAFKNLN